MLAEFFIIINFPFSELVSKSFKQIPGPFSVNLLVKAKDIHFLDVSEKETIFLVGAW